MDNENNKVLITDIIRLAVSLEHQKTINNIIRTIINHYKFSDEVKATIITCIVAMDEKNENGEEE